MSWRSLITHHNDFTTVSNSEKHKYDINNDYIYHLTSKHESLASAINF